AELFETVHAVLELLAAQAPLLVILEDLHWADQSTRDLLGFLFQRRFAKPVTVVASYRSDDLHRRHPLRVTVAQWSRIPGVHRLQLGPLGDSFVRALAASLHHGQLSEAEMQAIVTRAEGNAFLAEELVVANAITAGTLPDDLASLLLVRVDQLDEDAREVVRAASCAGRQVSHELLAAVVPLDPAALDRALRNAVDSFVLVPSGAGYAFRHALLGEAVYDDLLPGERVRRHAAFVDALCRNVAQGTAAELARHARVAHDVATAVRASIEAGDDAMAVGGPDDAARHYEVALELLGKPAHADERPAEVDMVSLTSRASDAWLAAGDAHRAIELVADHLAQLRVDAPDVDRARLMLTLAHASLMADSDIDALELTTEALGLVGPEATQLRARPGCTPRPTRCVSASTRRSGGPARRSSWPRSSTCRESPSTPPPPWPDSRSATRTRSRRDGPSRASSPGPAPTVTSPPSSAACTCSARSTTSTASSTRPRRPTRPRPAGQARSAGRGRPMASTPG
ncbi:MAG: ATP-binding protein, partial [Actinomycetota bacterium]